MGFPQINQRGCRRPLFNLAPHLHTPFAVWAGRFEFRRFSPEPTLRLLAGVSSP